ncbi:MAG: membrane protein insertase YidC [Cyanobacteria bacterium P01_F01_bin.33]
MDFGIGFLSNNVMLPILDFFYGILPSYGLAIIFLTLVIRFALFPVNAGQIRNMRKMKVAQPLMKKRMEEAQSKYSDDPVKLREAQSEIYQEFGNPLSGCLPLVIQMPVLFALFATLRGSPFADVPFDMTLQVLPSEKAAEVVYAPFETQPKNIFLTDKIHRPVVLMAPVGRQILVGDEVQLQFQGVEGRSFRDLIADAEGDASTLAPTWTMTKGADRAEISADGRLIAREPGEITLQAKVPGVASNTGFLFIEALGRVGARGESGEIHWDIVAMVLLFGLTQYVNTLLSSQGPGASNPNQDSMNKITPVLFSGMFLFFPLPAGVLIYIAVSNVFQTVQTYFLSREPLPENLQKLVVEEQKREEIAARKEGKGKGGGRESLPFER